VVGTAAGPSYTSGVPVDPIAELGARAKAASRVLATTSTEVNDAALLASADLLLDRHAEILSANAEDVEAAEADGQAPTVVDRLRLTDMRLLAMANGLRTVAALPDPVGEVADGWMRPNGLRVQRVRVPLGVVAIIYENRPNVTSDAFGLCLKAGNAAFLRGSSGAIRSNIAIASALREGLAKAGLPHDSLVLVEDTRHEAAVEFMRLRDSIDVLIPRGGPSLIRSVLDNATVPYVIDGDGNCHVYVDATADLSMAATIVENAKTQRPSVCNAAETLLVHRNIAATLLSEVAPRLEGVELVGDDATREILGDRVSAIATDDDYATEFLDLKLAVRVVDTLDAAIAHITRYGSGHSEAIVTNDVRAADRFVNAVDAAAVLVNASTRFVDGEELGFGAEIGISTQKLHARGPMGLRELTTLKFVIHGDGQTRG
jgi:glutamate-5-semialdehyde dehydrogenase